MNLFGTFPLLTIRTSPLDDPAKQRLKRIFELCFTSILFVTIFWWLFPCIALLIKLSSSGPVLFRQERQGLNNKRITCYKFRSMVSDSATINANGQYLQATLNILRVTPIGRFLRKTATGAKPGKQVRCRNVLTLTYGILKTIAYGSIARSFSKH